MSGPSWEGSSTQARQPGRCLSKNVLSVVIMSTASKRFAFQLSPALAAASRASVYRKRRCVGVRQGQRGDCAGYGGRRDYRWRGRCRDIDSTDVVVAATGKRDANQALATSDCWGCSAVGLRKWHGLWCGDQAIMRRGVTCSGKGGRASWWGGLARVGAGCVVVGMGCVK